MDNAQCPACNADMHNGTCKGCQAEGHVCSKCTMCNDCATKGMKS